ncbi:MAG: CocE/NonD family hydrolase [Thermomicrobiales bacterium]|nr:CocE/NonD family hydrolase [Thermomicrobiales bacterium]
MIDAEVETASITLPGEPAIAVEYDVPCRMRDGTVLRADVYRPADGSGPWPVLLIRLPYDKTQAENLSYAHPSWYARHGYMVVSQDVRGRYGSDGEWYPFRHEADDGYDTIEWAAHLPGANGKVGMYGFSYAGATQMLPAVQTPPSLAAMIPAMTGAQYYDGWTYTNGALNLAFVATWATDLAAGVARKHRDAAAIGELAAALGAADGWFRWLPLNGFPPLNRENAPYFFDWLDHPTYDEYWRQWSVDENYDRVAAPGLHIAGWYDVFLDGTVKNFRGLRCGAANEAARANQKLLIGPWFHMPWISLDEGEGEPAGHNEIDEWQIAWFDRFLKDEPNDVLDAPVTVYMMGEGRWRDFPDWPPPAAVPTAYYLHSAGRANSSSGDGALSLDAPGAEPIDVFTYDPFTPSPSIGGQSCCYPTISPMGPADQTPAEQWNSLLSYTSAPLERDLDLVGHATVTLYAATSAPDTDWTARLCDVHPDGRSINLKAGIVRARFRDSLTDPTPIEPNRIYRYDIDLGPVGARVRAGHRLRLNVASSDFPQWDRNLNDGGPLYAEDITAAVVATQRVFHDAEHPSCVTLPVLPAAADAP